MEIFSHGTEKLSQWQKGLNEIEKEQNLKIGILDDIYKPVFIDDGYLLDIIGNRQSDLTHNKVQKLFGALFKPINLG